MSFLVEQKRNGQTLVHVAILMVVFVALLTIAIDLGHIMNERRGMQNAADAGALAGAYELCFGDPAQAEQTAREYAIDRNGAQVADVSVGSYRVTVYARESATLYLAGFFGIETADINAKAVAACGAATSACGMWPIAFPEEDWLTMYSEDGCLEEDNDFYVWTGDQESKNPDCENVYECNLDDDPQNEVIGIHGRAFVDYGQNKDSQYPGDCRQPGCGEDELVCWIESEEGGEVQIPSCVPGTSGIKAGVKDEVNDRANSEDPIVGIPLYHHLGCDQPGDEPDPGYCPGGQRYYVTSIGCIEVLGWDHQLTLQRKDGTNPPWKGKAIHVKMACNDECDTTCGRTIGGLPEDWEMRAVSLVE
jgi:hypothetical protein